MDFTDMTDDDLYDLIEAAQTELGKRQTAEVFEQEVENLYASARQSGGIPTPPQGEPWKQPTHAGDAYTKGDIVTHDGVEWVSTVTPNVWEPGESGWHRVPEDDPETGEPGTPEWVRPTGAHDIYNKGDRVRFNDEIYESTLDANAWSPTDHPAGWKLIDEGEH